MKNICNRLAILTKRGSQSAHRLVNMSNIRISLAQASKAVQMVKNGLRVTLTRRETTTSEVASLKSSKYLALIYKNEFSIKIDLKIQLNENRKY